MQVFLSRIHNLINHIFLIGFKRYTKLHWVKIYFATPNFDRITKDERATFEAKISAIGGTMGLFTGFSIISGVEIFYFVAEGWILFMISFIKKLINKTKKNQTNIINVEEEASEQNEEKWIEYFSFQMRKWSLCLVLNYYYFF